MLNFVGWFSSMGLIQLILHYCNSVSFFLVQLWVVSWVGLWFQLHMSKLLSLWAFQETCPPIPNMLWDWLLKCLLTLDIESKWLPSNTTANVLSSCLLDGPDHWLKNKKKTNSKTNREINKILHTPSFYWLKQSFTLLCQLVRRYKKNTNYGLGKRALNIGFITT